MCATQTTAETETALRMINFDQISGWSACKQLVYDIGWVSHYFHHSYCLHHQATFIEDNIG